MHPWSAVRLSSPSKSCWWCFGLWMMVQQLPSRINSHSENMRTLHGMISHFACNPWPPATFLALAWHRHACVRLLRVCKANKCSTNCTQRRTYVHDECKHTHAHTHAWHTMSVLLKIYMRFDLNLLCEILWFGKRVVYCRPLLDYFCAHKVNGSTLCRLHTKHTRVVDALTCTSHCRLSNVCRPLAQHFNPSESERINLCID